MPIALRSAVARRAEWWERAVNGVAKWARVALTAPLPLAGGGRGRERGPGMRKGVVGQSEVRDSAAEGRHSIRGGNRPGENGKGREEYGLPGGCCMQAAPSDRPSGIRDSDIPLGRGEEAGDTVVPGGDGGGECVRGDSGGGQAYARGVARLDECGAGGHTRLRREVDTHIGHGKVRQVREWGGEGGGQGIPGNRVPSRSVEGPPEVRWIHMGGGERIACGGHSTHTQHRCGSADAHEAAQAGGEERASEGCDGADGPTAIADHVGPPDGRERSPP